MFCRKCKTALRRRVRSEAQIFLCPNRRCELHGAVQKKEILPSFAKGDEITEGGGAVASDGQAPEVSQE